MNLLSGLFAVLVTPFTASGDVDEAALRALCDFYLISGARGLVVASVFGEGHLLSASERALVTHVARARTPLRTPLVIGCHGDTGACARMAREAALAGATAVLVAPPEGSSRTSGDLIHHARSIDAACRLPQILLDYPPLCGDLPVAQIAALCRAVPAVRGIKLEDTPTAPKVRALRALLGPRLAIFTALGGVYAADELEAGADGLMTGAAFPEYLAAMIVAKEDRSPDLRRIHARALPRLQLEAQPGPGSAVAMRKAILQWRGVLPAARIRRRTPDGGAVVQEDARWLAEATRAMDNLAALEPR